MPAARFNQVALSVTNRDRSLAFYRDGIGMSHVGGTEAFRGRTTEAVQGMVGAASNVHWLMDDRPYFQLELFEFEFPVGRPYARGRVPQDVGYSRICFTVPDLVATRDRCVALGGSDTGNVHVMTEGRALCLHDPDGILVELVEVPGLRRARLTGVALSVLDLEVSRRSFVDGMGCVPVAGEVEDRGVLWGENGAEKRILRLDGGTIRLEISAYLVPPPRPWPNDYRIADIGILNVALGFETTRDIKARLLAMQAAGFKPNCPLVGAPGFFLLTYSNDAQGFSVETLMVGSLLRGVFGFRKAGLLDRAAMKLIAAVS